ncbi:MAG: TRAP transporter permease [Alphaproteobacteria bacterium]
MSRVSDDAAAPPAQEIASGSLQRHVETALGAALTLTAIGWGLDLPQRLDWALFTEQFLAAVLTLVLPLAFLAVSPRRKRTGAAGWWDVTLAAASAITAGYVMVAYPTLQAELVYRPWYGIVLSAVLILLVLEAMRRTCGLSLLLIAFAFIAYALLGHHIPGLFGSRPIQWDRLLVYLAMDTNALIGNSLQVAAEVVIPYILMGQILLRCGGADFFNDIALALAGRSRGGSGKIAVLSSALFGTVSGSAVANVVSGGIVTIPMMVKSGMKPFRAAAVEAVSSTGGQLMPPVMGASAFLMAEYLGVPYRDIVLAAIAPALLFYLALYIWCDYSAGRDRLLIVEASQIPRARAVLRAGWFLPLPFLALVVALLWLNWSPQRAALLACGVLYVCSIVFGYRGRRMNLRDVFWTISSTGNAVLEIIIICAGSGFIIGVLNITGLAFKLTLELGHLASVNVVLLLLVTAAIGMVLGLGLPTVAVYVLLASLIGPAMTKAGLEPIAAHMFLLYFGMLSMITPPVALASFAAASIAKADFWKTGWESMRIGWIAYVVPFVFVFQPSMLWRGNPWLGLFEFATAVVGVVLGTAALVGYARGPLAWSWRLAAAGIALLLFLPAEYIPFGWALNVAGLALGAAAIAYEARRARGAAALA